MKGKIDLERFICSWLKARQYCSDNECGYVVAALREQGLDYKDGEIMKIDAIDTSSPEWAEIVEECKHNGLEQAKKSNKEELMEVDGFDAELNALLKKYEHLPKKELQEPLEFYLGVVKDDLDVVREDKSRWTEEDEELCQDTLDAFEALANELNPSVDWGELYDWFKSIKQRMEE